MRQNTKNTKEQNGELENSPQYANEIDNKDYLITYEKIENTPFTIASKQEQDTEKTEINHYILMGKYRISEKIGNKKEAIKQAKKINWDTILPVIYAIVTELTQIEKIKNNIKK